MNNYHKGYPVYYVTSPDGNWEKDDWKYEDTHESIFEAPERPCIVCDKYANEDGHDPCIANLPGVRFACCGHGKEAGYFLTEHDENVRFRPLEHDKMRRYAEKLVERNKICKTRRL